MHRVNPKQPRYDPELGLSSRELSLLSRACPLPAMPLTATGGFETAIPPKISPEFPLREATSPGGFGIGMLPKSSLELPVREAISPRGFGTDIPPKRSVELPLREATSSGVLALRGGNRNELVPDQLNFRFSLGTDDEEFCFWRDANDPAGTDCRLFGDRVRRGATYSSKIQYSSRRLGIESRSDGGGQNNYLSSRRIRDNPNRYLQMTLILVRAIKYPSLTYLDYEIFLGTSASLWCPG